MENQTATIVIPIYNEAGSVEKEIGNLLASELSQKFPIVIVDDGSTDGTGDKLRKLHEDIGGFTLLCHSSNRGYGAALKTGIIKANTELIVITDADNSYPNHRIAELVALCEEERMSMVVGARTTAKSEIPLVRKPAKWFLNQIANYLSGQNIPDLNSGLRVFRREIVLDNLNLLCDGFSFTSTITLIMLCSNYPVKYVPIDYYTRSGSSKIRPFHDTVNFLILIITTVLYFRPLRVFLPPALALLGGGTLWGLWQVISQQDISGAPMLLIQTGFYLLTIALLADMIAKSRPVKHVRHLRNR